MKKVYLTTLVTSLTVSSSAFALPAVAAEAKASKPKAETNVKEAKASKKSKKEKKAKLENIPSSMSLAELQENVFFYEPVCRDAAVGISTNFGAQGSGVIVSRDGIILTAAHVVGQLGVEFEVLLADGTSAKAVAFFINRQTDSAVAKVISPIPEGGFPFRPIRKEADLTAGDWCTVIANGGGIQLNRPAPFRVGRVLTYKKSEIQNVLISDCTVTSGDSGGPLFDTNGNVCGINSAVGAGSALNNMHISSATFIQQWGDYLVKNKEFPSLEEVRKIEIARKKAAGESVSRIPKKLLPTMRKALKKQYPDLPKAGMEAMLNNASFSAGRLSVKATPALIEEFEKLGLDPVKYGIRKKGAKSKTQPKANKNSKKKQPKEAKRGTPAKPKQPTAKPKKRLSFEEQLKQQFGEIPQPALEFLKKKMLSNKMKKLKLSGEDEAKLTEMGVDMKTFRLRQIIIQRFGLMPEEAMAIVLKKFRKNAKGQYELAVTTEDVAKLKLHGVDLFGQKGKSSKTSSKKAMLTALFKRKYGNDLTKETLDILHSSAILDEKTGKLRMNFTAGKLKKLIALGVKVNVGNDGRLDPLAKNHGDSAASVAKYFPQTATPIHLMQGDKRVGLATAISQDGQLLCKSSSLKTDEGISISIAGVATPVKLIARDEISDLALIKAQLSEGASLEVAEWGDTPRRGKLLVSATEAAPMLGVVSVDKRIVPEKTMGVGNGNKAILGVVSDVLKSVDGSYIKIVRPKTPAAIGGIKVGDLITAVGGIKISSQLELRQQVGKYQGGDAVKFTVKRGGKTLDLMITLLAAEKSDMFSSDATNSAAQDLSALAGELSPRRTTFPEAFSHDALIWNDDCGGPVYTIDGKLLGINIARYSRITSYALTQKSVNEALSRMSK